MPRPCPPWGSTADTAGAQLSRFKLTHYLEQLRPKVEEALWDRVERAVAVPEHEAFGAIAYPCHDGGQHRVNFRTLMDEKLGPRREFIPKHAPEAKRLATSADDLMWDIKPAN